MNNFTNWTLQLVLGQFFRTYLRYPIKRKGHTGRGWIEIFYLFSQDEMDNCSPAEKEKWHLIVIHDFFE